MSEPTMCDWCGEVEAARNGECEDCWRLPGHEGVSAPSFEVEQLRARAERLHDAVRKIYALPDADLDTTSEFNQGVLAALGQVKFILDAALAQPDAAGAGDE
jgi:hypothetical protein